MIEAIKRHLVAVLSIVLLGFAALLLPATPASAASLGLQMQCTSVSATRWQCLFPGTIPAFNATILYTSMECGISATAFTIEQFQVGATPPNSTTIVAYQVAGNRGSLGGIANAASDVNIHVKANTTVEALIDLTPAPSAGTNCFVSISADY